MTPKPIKRLPSADWRTDDLHEQWARTEKGEFMQADGSLHEFLQYCCLLREIRHRFEADDAKTRFDGCAFFLRGGYFAFSYLNMTSTMALRGTIFGGLNHGRHPRSELPRFVGELQDGALARGNQKVHLLMVDEVKSGTGMGTVLNLVNDSIAARPKASACDVCVSFYAIRPGEPGHMTTQLASTVNKWQGSHALQGGCLSVVVRHFAGPLLGYDNDILCGIRTTTKGNAPKEAYELIKLSVGVVTLRCDSTDYPVIQADIDRNCLVEFLSNCAQTCTCRPSSAFTVTLARNIEANGCFVCKELYLKAAGLP